MSRVYIDTGNRFSFFTSSLRYLTACNLYCSRARGVIFSLFIEGIKRLRSWPQFCRPVYPDLASSQYHPGDLCFPLLAFTVFTGCLLMCSERALVIIDTVHYDHLQNHKLTRNTSVIYAKVTSGVIVLEK